MIDAYIYAYLDMVGFRILLQISNQGWPPAGY